MSKADKSSVGGIIVDPWIGLKWAGVGNKRLPPPPSTRPLPKGSSVSSINMQSGPIYNEGQSFFSPIGENSKPFQKSFQNRPGMQADTICEASSQPVLSQIYFLIMGMLIFLQHSPQRAKRFRMLLRSFHQLHIDFLLPTFFTALVSVPPQRSATRTIFVNL